MKKYNYDDIKRIISDIRNSSSLLSNNSDNLSTNKEDFISELLECKKYIIPEKREEWCSLIHGIMYEFMPVNKSMDKYSNYENSRNFENYDKKLANEILLYVCVAEIMESYEKGGLDSSVDTFNSRELTDWARADIIYDVLRFSMFGIEFVKYVNPEIINKPKFKRIYDEVREYLEYRKCLENRLSFAIQVKTTLEEYKKYCMEYYFWECDNTEEKLVERKEKLARIGDEYLLMVVNNTYYYARYILKLMKEENNTYNDKIFTSVYYSFNDYINLGCTGGHFADELYRVECYGQEIMISGYLLKNILGGLSLEHDYEVEERIDGFIGCTYSFPKLKFNIEIDKFNEYYREFFESKKRNICL